MSNESKDAVSKNVAVLRDNLRRERDSLNLIEQELADKLDEVVEARKALDDAIDTLSDVF